MKKDAAEAKATRAKFQRLWTKADTKITSSCLCQPGKVVSDGVPRANRADAGAVSVPSGLTVQPLATSKSSSNAPQRAVRVAVLTVDNGHQARSIR